VLRIPANRVPDDVLAGMREAARRRDREQADYAQLAADAADGDQRLRRAYDNAALAAAAEAIAYRAECSCVFAAVVRATPAGLEQIARRVGVRAVDPAPEVDALDRVEFNPPQPEQQTTVIESSPPVAPLLPAPVLTPRLTHPSASPTGTPPSPSPSATPPSTSSEPPAPESEPTDAATPERTDVPSALPVSPSATTPS
jgi:hypothetical protein